MHRKAAHNSASLTLDGENIRHSIVMQNEKTLEPLVAYGVFGWLLGTLTPGLCAALILADNSSQNGGTDRGTSVVLLIVVALCSLVGLAAGAGVGWVMKVLRSRASLLVSILLAPLLGLLWGVVTGGAGGLPIMIVGALFGAAIAGAVGFFAFAVFAAVYETLARRTSLSYWQGPALGFFVALFFALVVFGAFYLNSQ